MAEAADKAMEVKAVAFDERTWREIRGAKRRGSEDPVYKISKQPFLEAQLSASPSPGKTFWSKEPTIEIASVLDQLEELERDFREQKESLKMQAETLAKLQLRFDLMDGQNYEKIGASRRVVAYGIAEYVHNNFLTPYTRTAIQEKSANLPNNEEKEYFKFLNIEVCHGKWQQGSYEEVYIAWAAREDKSFSNYESVWLEELLVESENKFITMGLESNDLTITSAKDLRMALGRALSLEKHKRNQAYQSLAVGEKKICLQAVEDLMVVIEKGQLGEFTEVAEIIKFGCKLFKGSITDNVECT